MVDFHIQAGVTVTRAASAWLTPPGLSRFGTFQNASGDPGIDDVSAAVASANESADSARPVHGDAVVAVGPEVFFRVSGAGSTADHRRWLAHMSQVLTERGISGRINRPVRRHPHEATVTQLLSARPVSLFLSYRDEAAGRRWAPELRRAYAGGAPTAFVGANEADFPLPVGPGLDDLVRQLDDTYVVVRFTGDSMLSQTTWTRPDQAASCRIAPGTWEEHLDLARQTILDQTDHLIAAIIRKAGTGTNWIGLHQDRPEPPAGRQGGFLARRPGEWPDRVLDAYGIQLLTARQLDAAADLSCWDVRELGDGMYLVEARDLAAWFAVDEPDPDVVTQARSDFGPLIVTTEEINEYLAANRARRRAAH